jgi:GT2 family glycosyltransferase
MHVRIRVIMISFIIVNYNTKSLLKNLLISINKFFDKEEVIVVDNASSDNSAEMVSHEFPDVKLIANKKNVGFASANNQAMEIARGDVFVLINSDAELIDDSLKRAISIIKTNRDYGLIGCKLLNSDKSIQISVGRFPGICYAFLSNTGLGLLLPSGLKGKMLAGRYLDYNQQLEVDWVMGACMIVRRDVYVEIGGLNSGYFMFGEDMEWCYRIKKAGYKILYTPFSQIMHYFNKSASSNPERRYYMMYKNYYSFCNMYLGKTRTTIIRIMNIYGLLLRYVAFKAGLIKTNDPFLSYWFSNFKQALRSQFL